MVSLVTLQELLPLQEPEAGWDRNYGFWFRVFMLAAAVSHAYLIQGKYMVDDFVHSSRRLMCFVLGISGIYTGVGMVTAANLVFPIPFFYITMTPAFYVPLLILLYCILGKSRKLTKYVCFIATQKIMGVLYPIYQLLFRKVSTTEYVLPVILLLPVIKIVAKNVVLHFTYHLEDLTPETVIFTVDFYNALYLATCMESASTISKLASSRKLAAIQPTSAAPKRRQGRVAGGPNGIPTDLIEHSNILRETLGVLYTTECLVLTAYLEAFVPLFYCTYMLYMVQLPNAEYHTELRNVNRQNVEYTARVVFLFGLLQVGSFVLLVLLIRRNCGMTILYNLAFVLETQMALVQGKLLLWMLVTLACRVVHFGADYSFKFAWITGRVQ
ncbi:uncharacterized protein IUM83_02585 [Phytophthora cinnamomi]|uniref:uncharacterized protein n=1 Tax=Phytophthora cinnamomi TaxID=4785 RepID=UPI0035595C95|nr:hypothetical protein IUM83_02585 [Phytophthora cinnamomi]